MIHRLRKLDLVAQTKNTHQVDHEKQPSRHRHDEKRTRLIEKRKEGKRSCRIDKIKESPPLGIKIARTACPNAKINNRRDATDDEKEKRHEDVQDRKSTRLNSSH